MFDEVLHLSLLALIFIIFACSVVFYTKLDKNVRESSEYLAAISITGVLTLIAFAVIIINIYVDEGMSKGAINYSMLLLASIIFAIAVIFYAQLSIGIREETGYIVALVIASLAILSCFIVVLYDIYRDRNRDTRTTEEKNIAEVRKKMIKEKPSPVKKMNWQKYADIRN